MKKYKWGILGVNWIASRIAGALSAFDSMEILAAAARTRASVEAFAERFGVSRIYSSCEELARDPDIDIIYISTPHGLHEEHAMICLENGKHVLCEKPFTLNEPSARRLFDYADAKGLFIMEAMWTRFLPSVLKMTELIHSGVIGEVKLVRTEYCFSTDLSQPDKRYVNLALGGGSLLDLGVYNLTLTDMFLERTPDSIVSQAYIGPTGVDLRAAAEMLYKGGAMASIQTAFDLQTSNLNYVYGAKGYITFDSCSGPDRFRIVTGGDQEPQDRRIPFDYNGHEYQLAAVQEALRSGAREDPRLPQEATLRILRQMDAIRAQWNLKYPNE